jgi:flagellar hook-length control protein FliK
MQQLANNVLLSPQNNAGKVTTDSAKGSDKSDFFDAFQQAQSSNNYAGNKASAQVNAYSASAAAGSKKILSSSNADADDKVASVLGQISMGKKLPPEEKLQNAVTKLAQLAGLDEQQLQQLSAEDPKAMLKQLAAMLNSQSAENSGSDTIGDSSNSALAKLLNALAALLQQSQQQGDASATDTDQTLQALLSQLQQTDTEAHTAPSDQSATTKPGVNKDDEPQADSPLEQALAELLAALQQLPVNQTSQPSNSSSGDELLNVNSSTQASPQGQLQQLLAQLLADEQSSAKDGDNNSVTDKSLLAGLAANKAEQQSTMLSADGDGAAKASSLDKFSDSIKAALESVADNAVKSPLNKESLSDNVITDNKSTQNSLALGAANTNQRNEIVQYQLSMRQAGEPLQNTQELAQRFAPVMRQQLLTMVNNGVHHAEIRLDPPELGAMTVKLQVQGDHTQVQFHVTQPQTRDLLEHSMPRLRELLQQQGMQLADGQVSQGGGQQSQPQGQMSSNGDISSTAVGEISAEELSAAPEPSLTSTSAIDYYA